MVLLKLFGVRLSVFVVLIIFCRLFGDILLLVEMLLFSDWFRLLVELVLMLVVFLCLVVMKKNSLFLMIGLFMVML